MKYCTKHDVQYTCEYCKAEQQFNVGIVVAYGLTASIKVADKADWDIVGRTTEKHPRLVVADHSGNIHILSNNEFNWEEPDLDYETAQLYKQGRL